MYGDAVYWFCLFSFFCLIGCFIMIIWTPTFFECLICMRFLFLYLHLFSEIEHVSHGKVLQKYTHYYIIIINTVCWSASVSNARLSSDHRVVEAKHMYSITTRRLYILTGSHILLTRLSTGCSWYVNLFDPMATNKS